VNKRLVKTFLKKSFQN